MATLSQASRRTPFSQQHCLTSHLCRVLVTLTVSDFFTIFRLSVSAITDFQGGDYSSLRIQMVGSFPGGSEGKASACNAGDLDSIPGSGRSPGEGNGTPLQYSCLENPMDGGTWWATVHGVAKSRIQLSDFTFTSLSLIRQGPATKTSPQLISYLM